MREITFLRSRDWSLIEAGENPAWQILCGTFLRSRDWSLIEAG